MVLAFWVPEPAPLTKCRCFLVVLAFWWPEPAPLTKCRCFLLVLAFWGPEPAPSTSSRLERTLQGEKVAPEDAGQIDVQALIEKTTRDFNDRYTEGTFTELSAFCEQRRLKYAPPSDAEEHFELLAYIQDKLNLTVAPDKDGIVGVEILDHNPGQYRFRRGVSDSVASKKTEVYQPGAVAAGVFKEQFQVCRLLCSATLSSVRRYASREHV